MDKKYVPQHKQMAMGRKTQVPCPSGNSIKSKGGSKK